MFAIVCIIAIGGLFAFLAGCVDSDNELVSWGLLTLTLCSFFNIVLGINNIQRSGLEDRVSDQSIQIREKIREELSKRNAVDIINPKQGKEDAE
tara:strand:- start:13631 stop:13912 length:282 start_codon:yes stop_codon:yes gene_type:complete